MIRRKLIIALGVSVGAFAVSAMGRPDAVTPDCKRAEDWAIANADVLPRTYTSISKLTPAYRRAVFIRLTVEERREVWREHLAWAITRYDLNREQLAIVGEVAANLDKYITSEPRKEPADVEARIRATFAKPLAAAIFASLGPVEQQPNGTFEECECSTESDWCIGSNCERDIVSCSGTEWGCGFMQTHPCNGVCL
jgi:hypothetical protein